MTCPSQEDQLTSPPNSGLFKLEVRLLSGKPEVAQGEAIKRSKFSEEQIAHALRLAESGTPVVDVCRQIGVSEVTYYTWKKKFGNLGVSELRRLKMLEDENARLKRIVADLTLGKQILQEVVRLQLRMKVKRRKRISLQRGRPTPATGPNQNWEHGLRARSDARWTGIPGAQGDRSVES
jgi:putative transposase